MTTATIDDGTEYQLTAGGTVEVLRQQLPAHRPEILIGVADGDAVMLSLTLGEAAELAEKLAELVAAAS